MTIVPVLRAEILAVLGVPVACAVVCPIACTAGPTAGAVAREDDHTDLNRERTMGSPWSDIVDNLRWAELFRLSGSQLEKCIALWRQPKKRLRHQYRVRLRHHWNYLVQMNSDTLRGPWDRGWDDTTGL